MPHRPPNTLKISCQYLFLMRLQQALNLQPYHNETQNRDSIFCCVRRFHSKYLDLKFLIDCNRKRVRRNVAKFQQETFGTLPGTQNNFMICGQLLNIDNVFMTPFIFTTQILKGEEDKRRRHMTTNTRLL